MAGPITKEKILTAIRSQTDPGRIATLKTENACNRRLNRCVYWMHQARPLGFDIKDVVSQAVQSYPDTDEHRALAIRSLMRNYKRMVAFGGCGTENLARLRRGDSATASTGLYAGQKLEVDHIVPKALLPGLAKDFANLRYQPSKINRLKSDRIGDAQMRAVRIFARNGLISDAVVERLQCLRNQPSVRAARAVMPGTVSRLRTTPAPGFGSGATVPILIILKVSDLLERIREWEPRADSALTTAKLVQHQTAEHLTRTQALARLAESRAEEDSAAANRLESNLESWHARGVSAREHTEESLKRAGLALARSRKSIQSWKREGHFAREWQRRANYQEDRAKNEVERAEEALVRAQSALRHAEEQLERARERTRVVGRDSDGKPIREPIDTTPYENKVAAAEQRVERCEERLDRANDALSEATAEREAADARVEACASAVRVSIDAESIATSAMESARNSMTSVDRACEEHIRVCRIADRVTQAAKRALEAVEAIRKSTSSAATRDSEAHNALQNASNCHSSSRQRSTMACMEISWRLDMLRAFDAPVVGF